MRASTGLLHLPLILALTVAPGFAQPASPAAEAPSDSEPDETADDSEDALGELEQIEEVIVVTASRTEQPLNEVSAAITVLGSEDIERIPADNFGGLLRNVPGLNVSQLSARDIQITGRKATQALATSQLVLLDGRTLYLDFFGFVMWDFVPMDPREIKQIEVVRGPGSAVWGANAMSGVINLITKPAREMQGTSVTLGGGEFDTFYGSLSHAGVNGNLGYKLAASYFEQGPFERPTGTIPGTQGPGNPLGTPYPPYENSGTSQPKLNLRIDWDQRPDTTWTFSGGYAGTDGTMHSALGPFDINSGSQMSFVKADWNHRAARATFFVNLLDGDATNLLSVGPDGRPIAFDFKSETYSLDYSDTRILGESHILTYGATARRNNFDLSIAPRGDMRQEFGVFLQDEILFGSRVRWLLGARWDDIDPIGSVVSPRTTLLYSPTPSHTFRASYNRAFRAPSMINNYLDIILVNAIFLPGVGSYAFPTRAVGNPALQEERLDAYEVGYAGSFDAWTLTLSVYRNETSDLSNFFQAAAYTSQNPPPGFPFPPFILDVPPPLGLAGLLPALFTYRNIGEIDDRGVEVSLEYRPQPAWTVNFNYSYQDQPKVAGIDQVTLPNGTTRDPVNTPPEHRANLGLAYNGARFFVGGTANYVDDAFWTDVLDSRYWGPTDSYTQINLSAGVYLSGDRVTLSIIGQNIFDEEIQQHVFGDILRRKVTGQVLFRF